MNLNRHRVFGSGPAGTGQYAGILVSGRTGVTVTGGQVDHFSSGVALINSTATTVSNMTVQDNVGSYDQYAFGDGILLEYSANNKIIHNHVSRNGPFDNIGVLGRLADHNLIQANTVTDNFSVGINGVGTGANIELNAFLDFFLPDRGSFAGRQPGHQQHRAAGVSLRDLGPGQHPGTDHWEHFQPQRSRRQRERHRVGLQPLLMSTPNLQGLIEGNTVDGNSNCGILVNGFASRIISNTATGNGLAPFHDSQAGCFYKDLNGGDPNNPPQVPSCPNQWFANTYNTTDGSCPAVGGHQVSAPPMPAFLARPHRQRHRSLLHHSQCGGRRPQPVRPEAAGDGRTNDGPLRSGGPDVRSRNCGPTELAHNHALGHLNTSLDPTHRCRNAPVPRRAV
ncbi:MAG: right-handed parallel beta-helix repeat-containing protein [Actinomycetota bacterium]|nr:right-handed parallel beta-helix repeat-containing protein [Actinomycetota bacterium]